MWTKKVSKRVAPISKTRHETEKLLENKSVQKGCGGFCLATLRLTRIEIIYRPLNFFREQFRFFHLQATDLQCSQCLEWLSSEQLAPGDFIAGCGRTPTGKIEKKKRNNGKCFICSFLFLAQSEVGAQEKVQRQIFSLHAQGNGFHI